MFKKNYCLVFFCMITFHYNLVSMSLLKKIFSDLSSTLEESEISEISESEEEEEKQKEEKEEEQENITQNILSLSTIELGESFALSFDESIKKASHYSNKALIEQLLQDNPTKNMWKSLINHGFKKDAFTPSDLKWVLEKNEKCLLEIMLSNPQSKELLTDIVIEKEVYLSASFSSSIGADSHSEYQNILVYTVEQGYILIFEMILNYFPDLIKEFNSLNSVKRQERSAEGYVEKEYTFNEWLTRKNNIYINRNCYAGSKNYYYIEAAKVIINKLLETNKNIDKSWASIITLLFKQNDLEQEKVRLAATKFQD
jgi:hypothetical protein